MTKSARAFDRASLDGKENRIGSAGFCEGALEAMGGIFVSEREVCGWT